MGKKPMESRFLGTHILDERGIKDRQIVAGVLLADLVEAFGGICANADLAGTIRAPPYLIDISRAIVARS
jgi:hypothetical protein